jgi:hypothetical protein
MELLDPTAESAPIARQGAPRLAAIEGGTVGLLDISKPRGDVFLDRLAELLAARNVTVRRYLKPTHARPASADLRTQIAGECDAVVEALAD